jgi:hypothetical protein
MDRTIILLAILSILLVVAVGYVCYCLGTIALAIFKDFRESRKLRREMDHPTLGILTLEGELWSGKTEREGIEIPFRVAGSSEGPDRKLVERLTWFLDKFSDFQRTAVEFIRKQEPEVARGVFTFSAVSFLWETKPDHFGMEFDLAGDDESIWRVEFVGGRPHFVGRDD